MGPKMITHTCYYLGLHFPNAQDICYTELAGKVPPDGAFCERDSHKMFLGINFPIARAFFTQKRYFRIICVIMSGLILCREMLFLLNNDHG